MKKIGVGHIEVILAFVLFISSVVFMFYIFHPTQNRTFNENSVVYLFDKIEQNISTDLLWYGVRTNITGDRIAINLNLSLDELNLSVQDAEGNMFKNKIKGTGLGGGVVCISNDSGSIPYFVYIYASPDIVDVQNTGNCPVSTDETNYSLGAASKRKIISENKIIKLNNTYYNQYSTLKKQFVLRDGEDFEFEIVLSNSRRISGNMNVPKDIEINSLNKRMEIIMTNGTIQFADITIKTW